MLPMARKIPNRSGTAVSNEDRLARSRQFATSATKYAAFDQSTAEAVATEGPAVKSVVKNEPRKGERQPRLKRRASTRGYPPSRWRMMLAALAPKGSLEPITCASELRIRHGLRRWQNDLALIRTTFGVP